jgi:hypothetical protein
LKPGAGLTSYRLKRVSVDGQLLTVPDSPRFKTKGNWWSLGFNETIFGGGLDASGIRLGNARVGAKTLHGHSPLAGTISSVWRHELRLLASVSF